MSILHTARKTYDGFASILNRLQSPLLLAIRLYWGWQFMQDGWGKLTHLDKVTGLLHQPESSCAAHDGPDGCARSNSAAESLFTFGIASRLTSLVLFVNMTMAYLSVPDDRVNFSHIFSKPERFLRRNPVHLLVRCAADPDPGPGTVRRRHIDSPQICHTG